MESTKSQPNLRRRRGFGAWLAVVGISVVLAIVVPYALIPFVDQPLATYFFWTGFSLVVALFVFWGVRSWKDDE